MAEQITELLGGMRSETTVTVVAEPATLRPHFVSRAQHVEVRMRGEPGGAGQTMTQSDRRVARYRYDAPRAP
jgi:hypothetical protein